MPDNLTMAVQNALATDIQITPDGRARVTLAGRLNAQTVPACWNRLERELFPAKITVLEVDAGGLEFCDGAGLALLRYLNMGKMTAAANDFTAAPAAVLITGLPAELQKNFHAFTTEDYETFRAPSRRKCHSLPDEVGNSVAQVGADLREQVIFLGEVVASLPATLANRKKMRWPEIRRIFELAGANAVPIISLISFLVGLIIAFETSQPLAQFGAQIYVANMIGLVMVRELGPLLAAILLAGRSGSAFAAEIGTMKVNEELDALKTLGLDPIRFLVIQRIIAGVLLSPLLAFYATFMGILGGVLVTVILGFPLSLVLHQLASSVQLSDVILDASKGLVFGIIVSAVGCLRGLQTRQGPSAVGVSTTRAVVTSILLIVIADAVFSVLYFFLMR
jgi:phospholipid/cholesterol/gamma-HCH transport system permease protein